MMSLLKLESRKKGSNSRMAKKERQSLSLRGNHLQSTTVDRVLQFAIDVAGAMVSAMSFRHRRVFCLWEAWTLLQGLFPSTRSAGPSGIIGPTWPSDYTRSVGTID